MICLVLADKEEDRNDPPTANAGSATGPRPQREQRNRGRKSERKDNSSGTNSTNSHNHTPAPDAQLSPIVNGDGQ